MKNLSITELEALTFFGVIPTQWEPENWHDTDSVYEVHHDSGLWLTCAIHPSCGDARLRLLLGETLLFEWNAMDLRDIRCVEDNYGSFLEFLASDTDVLTLRLTPEFLLKRHSRAATPADGGD